MTGRILALDVGKKHTGVAFADYAIGIALPLNTIHHQTVNELLEKVRDLFSKRKITTLVIGLPVLMSGDEGEQAAYTRDVATLLQEVCPECRVAFLDERETNTYYHALESQDKHAQAATNILRVFLERENL